MRQVTKKIKTQLKMIDKFENDYQKSTKENETEFLAKVIKRQLRSEKALQEVD